MPSFVSRSIRNPQKSAIFYQDGNPSQTLKEPTMRYLKTQKAYVSENAILVIRRSYHGKLMVIYGPNDDDADTVDEQTAAEWIGVSVDELPQRWNDDE